MNSPSWLVTFVTESNKIEGITRDPTETELKAHERFIEQDILRIEDVAAFVQQVARGAQLRRSAGMDVRVGDHRPPPGGPQIEPALQQILDRANRGDDPFDVHLAFETLHPFMDGNGRSGRALWAWMMIQQGRGFEQIGFLHAFYYQTLSRTRAKDRRFEDAPTGSRDLYWCWHLNEPVIIEYREGRSYCIHCRDDLLDDGDSHTFIAHVKKPGQ